MANVINGLDPQQIQGMVDAVKKDPQSAQAKFSARTIWKTGFDRGRY